MTDSRKRNKDFKEAIGAFIIGFSELEYGLVLLCSMTETDIRSSDYYVSEYLGKPLETKRNRLTSYINEHLLELKDIWCKVNQEIGQLNRERRFLAHGFTTYYLPGGHITTSLKEKVK